MNSSNNAPDQTKQPVAENQHITLVEICQQIGQIAGSNYHYTAGLARRIEETGKPLEQFTVAELLALHEEHSKFFNQIYSGGSDE